jgi:arylsulfatase A-like enzyme
LNEAYLPLWLQQAGYDTYYTGKLFNAHNVDNYNAPFPAGWNGSDFLVDPYTYMYLNATFQRNQDPPVSYEGQYLGDVLAQKALGFLDDAAKNARSRPFFLGIAPIAPHSNVNATYATSTTSTTATRDPDQIAAAFGPPVPAARHADLFQNVSVPRTPNFNPSFATGASWVRALQPQTEASLAFNDHFYRQRLRALQSVDELVASVVERLAEHGLLENTFIFYTSDNGFHIGQHRLPPGKACGFEEDINVPLIVRGPGVPRGRKVADVVTSHVDLAPTLLRIAGVDLEVGWEDLDGEVVPLMEGDLNKAASGRRHEHVTVEYWGMALSEGHPFLENEQRWVTNNTYKALRIIGAQYNFYYAVWCNNEHEFHDLTVGFSCFSSH